jgi:hypothetical protein
MKNSNELIRKQSMAEDERMMFEVFAMAEVAKEDAAKFGAKAAKAQAEAEWLTDRALRMAEALRRRRGDKPYTERRGEGSISEKLDRTRKLLVKALGMLGSERVGERASAALKVEKFRTRLGRTWDQLIVEEFEDDQDDDDGDEDLDDDEEEPVA